MLPVDMSALYRHVQCHGYVNGVRGRNHDLFKVSYLVLGFRYSLMLKSHFLFHSLLRLRQELSKLIGKHTDKINDPVTKATTQSSMYEGLLQGLSVSLHCARASHVYLLKLLWKIAARHSTNDAPKSSERNRVLARARTGLALTFLFLRVSDTESRVSSRKHGEG
jgi:hypothetical protein